MQKNVGGFERPARLAVGTALAIVGITGYAGLFPLAFVGIGQALTSVVVFLLGAILLVTGYVGWCPITYALGINTYRDAESASEETTAGRTH